MIRTFQLLTLLLYATIATAGDLDFRFEGEFSAQEQRELRAWIAEVAQGVERLVGPFPFAVRIDFRRTPGRTPVPWANTLRGRVQGVRLHVDPTHPREAFRQDWTAPHELSHLVLPYLGRSHAWFAEGFASYMQHQVMHATGVLTAEQAAQRYQRRLDEAAKGYRYPEQSFVEMTPTLRANRRFRTLYWGGAAFFLQLDSVLRARADTTLVSLMARYLQCCREHRTSLDGLVTGLDRLSGDNLVSDTLARFGTSVGFPHYTRITPDVVAGTGY